PHRRGPRLAALTRPGALTRQSVSRSARLLVRRNQRDPGTATRTPSVRHHFGAGMFVFQMSRWSFHCPPWRFQTTTYLPVSTVFPPSPVRMYVPTSWAVSAWDSTSTTVSFTSFTPESIAPFHSLAIASRPRVISPFGGKAQAAAV